MQFDSLDDIRAFCRDLPGGDRALADVAAAAAAKSDKAAGQPRPPRRTRDLAGAMAGPRTAAARSRHHRRVRRQSRRRRARRLGLSAGRHRADGGEFCRRRRGHQPDRQSWPAPICAWCRSSSSGRRAISPTPPRWSADEFLDAVDIGYRTVPDDCDLLAVGEMGIANTTTAAMLCAALLGGGAARWAGRGTGVDDERAGAQARGDRGRAGFPSRHSRRSAGGGGSARRPRTRGDRRRRARGAATQHPGAARRLRRDIGRAAAGASRCRQRSIIAAPGTSRPNPATAICCANSSLDPLLDLDMRLGEASGAGVAILLMRAALACHAGMATFAEAGVSGAED